jgi:hypothetical protein
VPTFLGIIIGGAFWLNNRRNRIANASIHSIDLEAEGQANSTDELPMSQPDPDRYHLTIIDGAPPDDEDTEPPYIGWFY